MNASYRNLLVQNLSEIYTEHEWIDLITDPDILDSEISSSELNVQCLHTIANWIDRTLGLDCKYEFPYLGVDKDYYISDLFDGFSLLVNTTKIIFIPSQNIDITTCEIPQEWVDLPNWSGDYYVPIQVDLEAKYLHLWGSITYQQLQQTAQLNPLFRYYHLDAAAMTANLDVLWTSCELAPLPKANRGELTALNPTQAHQSIDRLAAAPLPNFSRLLLPFSEWGAILNDRHYFSQYLQMRSIARDSPPATPPQWLNLSDWMTKQVATLDRHWETLEHFLNPPQPLAMRGLQQRLRHAIERKNYRDIPLQTVAQIDTEIGQLYRNQTEIPRPDRQLGVEDLVTLMENSTDETIRWKAIEYLWIIDPYYPKLPTRHIRDLGIQFTIDSLALMISQLPIDRQRRAILLRVYPMSDQLYLPAEVKLAILDSDGEPILLGEDKPFEAISRVAPQDNYIQLYFVADIQDRFSVRVSLGKQQFIENFIV
jgi:Protein of unknown function (DUF1822)